MPRRDAAPRRRDRYYGTTPSAARGLLAFIWSGRDVYFKFRSARGRSPFPFLCGLGFGATDNDR